MNPITIPNITIPVIGLPTIGIPSVGFPSASGGGFAWPAGLKESIKAIYDPAKQGMTNYDVIEAYVEDFTNWNYVKARGTVTVSQHKFIITECILNGLGIVEDVQEPYSNLTVRITGITDNQGVLITDYVNGQHQIINTITEDGIYTIEDRHHFIGFGCNFVGTCNITIEQLPTSILKDLSGNGNHAYLYGGKGKLNSGMGVYQEDFTAWKTYNRADVDITPNILHITKVGTSNAVFISNTFLNNRNIYKLDIKGITNQSLYIGNYASANSLIKITQDGLYEIDSTKFPDSDIYGIGFIDFIGDCDITITQIPDYPNLLCYDGKMYAVCYGFPILEDYTVMADRTWFDIRSVSCFIGKRNRSGDNLGAFEFEFRANQALSFGRTNSIIFADSGIVYQTKNSYNGIGIESGLLDDTDVLIIGAAQQNINNRPQDIYIGCHGKIIIADRSFTEDEITWLKDNWKKI